MGNGRDRRALLLPDLENLHHKRDGIVLLKPAGDRVVEDGWCKWAERFTPLDLRIEDRLHVRTPGIADNRAVAERTRTPLQSTLKPADDLAVGDGSGRAPAKLPLLGNFLHPAGRRSEVRTLRGKERCNFVSRELRPPIGVVHDESARAGP